MIANHKDILIFAEQIKGSFYFAGLFVRISF